MESAGAVSPKQKAKRRSLKGVKGQKTGQEEARSPLNKNKDKVAAIQDSSPSSPVSTVNCMEGMNAPELTMVRRLAGNDAVMRKKTIRKLRKWLSILAQKVPDSPGKAICTCE